ncbi:MAG: DUF533 domain-containing protein [Albidovulum sp.]|uniref:DUF533 domain-containing protein n=1 Tax=Albidovulum sp. TaxID=1872424 RepID=UPI003CC3D782
MSLMGTLAKVAIGIAVAKGVGSMMQRKGEGPLGGGVSSGGRGSGLEDMMGDILGGGASRRDTSSRGGGNVLGGSGGGLGDFLEELGDYAPDRPTGRSAPGRSGGGLDDLIGGLGGGSGGGGLGDLLGGMLGGALGGAATKRGGGFGDILNDSLGNCGEPKVRPSREQDAAAGLMLRAMIQAAKADGRVDAREQEKLLGNLGDVSPEERRFVEAELRAPVDVRGLAGQVPRGLEAQVYTMSIMGIDLDNQKEAEYLHELATALRIDRQQVNHIHARLGVPAIYG